MDKWAEIRHLSASEGMSQRAIARELGVARKTVERALSAEGPPKYQRPVVPSIFEPYADAVCALLREHPTIKATVIAERVGWAGSPSWFRKQIAVLRPMFTPPDPADRLFWEPGDAAQCDLWFPDGLSFEIGRRREVFPVLVIAACNARHINALMIPTRTTTDLLGGTWSLLENSLEAVPRRLIWDNEAGIGRRNKLAEGVAAFAGTLGTRIVQLPPADPESKGIVERAIQYLEGSFLPARTFTGPDDFNTQLQAWLNGKAHHRLLRDFNATPAQLIGADHSAMLNLPPIAPPFAFTDRIRLARDYYVRVLGNDYSVDPVAISRMVDIHADLTEVVVKLDGLVVARHARAWGSKQTLTDPEHVTSAARLRAAYQARPSAPGRESEDGHDQSTLLRDLSDYDTAFGLDLDEPVIIDGIEQVA